MALYPRQANTFYAVAAQRRILVYFNLGTNLSNCERGWRRRGPSSRA